MIFLEKRTFSRFFGKNGQFCIRAPPVHQTQRVYVHLFQKVKTCEPEKTENDCYDGRA